MEEKAYNDVEPRCVGDGFIHSMKRNTCLSLQRKTKYSVGAAPCGRPYVIIWSFIMSDILTKAITKDGFFKIAAVSSTETVH